MDHEQSMSTSKISLKDILFVLVLDLVLVLFFYFVFIVWLCFLLVNLLGCFFADYFDLHAWSNKRIKFNSRFLGYSKRILTFTYVSFNL